MEKTKIRVHSDVSICIPPLRPRIVHSSYEGMPSALSTVTLNVRRTRHDRLEPDLSRVGVNKENIKMKTHFANGNALWRTRMVKFSTVSSRTL